MKDLYAWLIQIKDGKYGHAFIPRFIQIKITKPDSVKVLKGRFLSSRDFTQSYCFRQISHRNVFKRQGTPTGSFHFNCRPRLPSSLNPRGESKIVSWRHLILFFFSSPALLLWLTSDSGAGFYWNGWRCFLISLVHEIGFDGEYDSEYDQDRKRQKRAKRKDLFKEHEVPIPFAMNDGRLLVSNPGVGLPQFHIWRPPTCNSGGNHRTNVSKTGMTHLLVYVQPYVTSMLPMWLLFSFFQESRPHHPFFLSRVWQIINDFSLDSNKKPS